MLRIVAILTLCVSLVATHDALAQGNSGKAKPGKGHNAAKVDKPGKGPKTIPPGQIKRYTRGAKLPNDLVWTDIGDLGKWKLPLPGRGNRYIRVDDQILEVTNNIAIVVAAVGIVSDLLR